MSTLEIQCGTCANKPKLSYELSFPPTRICSQYPKGVPDYVSTIDPEKQKPCPSYKEK